MTEDIREALEDLAIALDLNKYNKSDLELLVAIQFLLTDLIKKEL